MKKKVCGTEEVLYRIGLAAALVAAAGCLLWRWLPEEIHDWCHRFSFCVIYRSTGYLCPGCGGTRALKALLQGHLWESFLYHPLVVYGVGWYVCFMGSHTLARIGKWHHGMKWNNGYLVAALALLAGNFIIKNLIHLITGVDVLAWLGQQFVL